MIPSALLSGFFLNSKLLGIADRFGILYFTNSFRVLKIRDRRADLLPKICARGGMIFAFFRVREEREHVQEEV